MSATAASNNRKICFIADIGTTTIKASLCVAPYDTPEQSVAKARTADRIQASVKAQKTDRIQAAGNCGSVTLAASSEKNAQSVFGLDVISRVLYAHHNGVAPLQQKVLGQLLEMLCALCHDAGIQPDSVSSLIITGNTIMLHLVRGFSVQGFELAPFTPVSLEAAEVSFGALFGSVLNSSGDNGCTGEVSGGLSCSIDAQLCSGHLPSNETPVFFPPCIDGFIGADAVCAVLSAITGYAAFQGSDAEKAVPGGSLRYPVLLADVGTNTEIVLIQEKYSLSEDCTAACVPECAAPENFSIVCCSTAAGPAFEGGVLGGRYTGSELIHMLETLLASGAMDETGLLVERAPDLENIQISSFQRVTQDAIRQLQLAKGAVCAAIETLLHEEELSVNEIGSFVLCGNFGSALSADEAGRIGLFPAGLADVAVYAGNAAEQGARLLCSEEMRTLAKKIAASGKLVQLADSRFFARRYIERMNFTD